MNQTASAIHFIVNPWAGKSTDAVEQAILQYAQKHDLRWQIDVAREKYSLRRTTRAAMDAGARCIVSVGGDGTLNEVSAVVMGSGIPLGILPCGTGNDFVRAIGIPTDVEKALDIIRAQCFRPIDMGTVNGMPFINIAGAGFDADVDIYVKQFKSMGLTGLPAYMAATLRTVIKYDFYNARIEMRGVEPIPGIPEQPIFDMMRQSNNRFVLEDMRILLIAACNGRAFGGGMPVAPFAVTDDGLFDVCIVHAVNRRTILRMLPKLLKGSHIHHPDICACFRARELKMTLDRPVNIELDGEVQQADALHIVLHPSALRVAMPPECEM